MLSLRSVLIESAPILDQMKVSLWRVHIYLFFQLNSQEGCAYVHLMDLKIELGGDCKCQHNMGQARSWRIHSLVVDAFDWVISTSLAWC